MKRSAALEFLAFFEVLLLGSWLGATGFFSFAVPQSAFEVITSRQLVGQLVTSTITKVEILGLIIGAVLIVLQLATWKWRVKGATVRLSLLIVMLIAAALSKFWVTPEMVTLRGAMGPSIEDLPATDSLRVQFANLHVYSVGLMMFSMVAGVVTLFLTVRSWLRL